MPRFGLILVAFVLVQSTATSALERPNILLLMAEDMSSRVGAFGDEVAKTPNLDALAKQGVRYTNTFTTAGVCAPSRAAHILGMHQIATGTQHMRGSGGPDGGYRAVPPEGVKAYPELLRAAGYYTYTDAKLDYQFSTPFPNSGPPTIWGSEGEAAPDWRGREPGQPFFGFRNFGVTHESGVFTPLGSMPKSLMHFVLQVMRWWLMDEAPQALVAAADVALPPYYPDTPTVRGDLARHYNNIAFMDEEVGAILQRLQEDGLADSTIVIWTTDHGDGLPRAKRELFDSGIKVPMIIRWPEEFRPDGIEPGGLDTRLISFVDLAPTILQLAGVTPPTYLQGQDFGTAAVEPREYIYASRDRIDEVPDRQRAVRDSRFKYIRSWYPQQPESTGVVFRDNVAMVQEMREMYARGELDVVQSLWFEAPGEERLFDLQADPYEVNNIAGDPVYADDLARLRGEMDNWLQRVGDWSDQPESEMVELFQPGGEQQVTPAPIARVANGMLEVEPQASGHSLEYRMADGQWRLYTDPVPIAPGNELEVRAVRYGWKVSDIVPVR
jgi:arylsulfatase A-like enzyme